MTTVVLKDGILSADTLVSVQNHTDDSIEYKKIQKIRTSKDFVVSGSGNSRVISLITRNSLLKSLVRKDKKILVFFGNKRGFVSESNNVLVISKEKDIVYLKFGIKHIFSFFYVLEVKERKSYARKDFKKIFAVIGSGCSHIKHKKNDMRTAKELIEYTSEFDKNTNDIVTSFDIETWNFTESSPRKQKHHRIKSMFGVIDYL